MIDLTGRRAVVTGASRGIGQETAIALARAGCDVCSLHLPDPEHAPETARRIGEAGRRALMIEGDVADPDTVDACARQVTAEWGGIDIWVNNASRMLVRPFLEMTDAEWRDLMGSNFFGYYHGCRAAIRAMLPQGGGHIVNVSSVTARQPISGLSAYVAAKGGVVALTRALALEFGARGLVINAVAPGAVETPMNTEAYTPAVRAAYEARIGLGRVATPREIADVVVFLASDAARYVSGHELVADGGLTINGDLTL